MAKMTHLSQIALRIQTDKNENPTQELSPPSSPLLPLSSSQGFKKPKKKSTITPRTFTRFFSPRSSSGGSQKIGTSRQILRDITASGSNNPFSTQTKGILTTLSQATSKPAYISTKRKRTPLASLVTGPDQSSPLKKKRSAPIKMSQEYYTSENASGSEDQMFDSDSEDESSVSIWVPKPIKPIVFAKPPGRWGPLSSTFRRELFGMNSVQGNQCTFHDYRNEVACFHTSPSDSYTLTRPGRSIPQGVIPFCTASCNTNSLVAVGDEDGRISILESDENELPPFSRPYLVFTPHSNAIVDVCFSFDDRRLATAGGDKTVRIIDMFGQTTTHVLNHDAGVKQVRFQPGGSDIVATSTRSGNVQIWDLRCSGGAQAGTEGNGIAEPRPIHGLYDAHAFKTATYMNWSSGPASSSVGYPSRSNERGAVSITGLSFLNAGRENLFVTGSECDARVKLWDLRKMRSHSRHGGTPLSTTTPPKSHTVRPFGLTSLAISGDGQRLYTLCRDNTVYTYATSHLLNGQAPELWPSNSQPRRSAASNQIVRGPMYGFRHPAINAITFYVRLAVRPATAGNSELLAVGSNCSTPVLFPTDERYFHFGPTSSDHAPYQSYEQSQSQSGMIEDPSIQPPPCWNNIHIFQTGVRLIGHAKEATALTWTPAGDLVSVSDDHTAKCWRQKKDGEAKDARTRGPNSLSTFNCGWASVHRSWDNDDE